jgi:L-alanine-DL-glutamate epimerase-like enolase superfamily enzyme
LALEITDVRFETFQSSFEWSFVRVYVGEEYGTGEAGPIPAFKGCEEAFRALLVGEDALKINRIEEKLRHAILYAGTSYQSVVSAVNMALHDLIGKHLNMPTWRLIGGDRDEIPVYVDAHTGEGFETINALLLQVKKVQGKAGSKARVELERDPILGRLSKETFGPTHTPESYAKRAGEMKRAGYSTIKFDLDIPTPYTEHLKKRSGEVSLKEAAYMGEITQAVRDEIGDDVELAIDLHWRYDLRSALRICKTLEPYMLRWIEDLTPATKSLSNLDELGMLSSKTTIPIATGENLRSVSEFKELLGKGVSVWTPDLAKAGGITEGRRIAELASLYDLEFSPHNISSPIGTMATAHACSLANTLGVLEFHSHGFPMWREMVKTRRPIIEGGSIRLGEEAGLGVELDERYLERTFGHFEL